MGWNRGPKLLKEGEVTPSKKYLYNLWYSFYHYGFSIYPFFTRLDKHVKRQVYSKPIWGFGILEWMWVKWAHLMLCLSQFPIYFITWPFKHIHSFTQNIIYVQQPKHIKQDETWLDTINIRWTIEEKERKLYKECNLELLLKIVLQISTINGKRAVLPSKDLNLKALLPSFSSMV